MYCRHERPVRPEPRGSTVAERRHSAVDARLWSVRRDELIVLPFGQKRDDEVDLSCNRVGHPDICHPNLAFVQLASDVLDQTLKTFYLIGTRLVGKDVDNF
jgi:hypothetical protein